MGTVTNDALSAEARQPPGQENKFTPDRIAALIERWRPAVLREMERRRLWRGVSAPEREDQLQDVALVLCARDFESEEHVRRALWMGLGFRARDFWKSARRRELPVGEFFEEILGDDRLEAVEDAAAAAADRRHVDDCLAELNDRERVVYKLAKGEGVSRRKVARALGMSEPEVLRTLYSAQRKIDQVAVLAVAGRMCGRRRPAVESLARGQARGLTREQARAHLAHCRDCLLAFRAERAALSARVASILPLPSTAVQDQGAGLAAIIDHVRAAPGAIKRQLYEVAGRTPSGGDEAIAGAGGLALGTKVVVTLCVGAAAGGGAVCVNQLGGLPVGGTNDPKPAERAKVREKPKTRPVKAAQAAEPQPEAPEKQPARSQGSGSGGGSAPSPEPVRKDPPQEFFGGGGGSTGGSNQVQPSSTAPASPSGSGSGPGSGGGSSSQGGGGSGEFFGE